MTKCDETSPALFFLIMASLVITQGGGIMPLGPNGWLILGIVPVFGTAVIWWASRI